MTTRGRHHRLSRRRVLRTGLASVVLALFVFAMPAAPLERRTSCTNATQLASWSLVSLARQTIVVPVAASTIASAGPVALNGFGGVLLFGDVAPAAFGSIVAHLQAETLDHRGLLIMTDDEGGGVWRLGNLVAPLPWARDMASWSPARITSTVKTSALALHRLGITMDLAPVLDLDGRMVVPSKSDPDGLRSFGASASLVSTDGAAYMAGLIAGGVTPVVKHFPGLGGTSPNTDYGPAATAPWTSLETTGLVPFEYAIAHEATAIMVGNVTIPGLTSLPASLSTAVLTGVLRTQLGFKGLIMTDSLSAGAISAAHYTPVTGAVAAVSAGADVVLYGLPTSQSAVAEAVAMTNALVSAVQSGHLSRTTLVAAAEQVLAAKNINLCTTTP